ncbi:MAG TPA: sulfur reduction protein DsrS [Gammaproteobacteria bacterium]|nr:sulfur reduction protein DsrS [Gammaproteobacteria bacterium]
MTLSAEDNLRLNVLLSQELHAVRIDESKMIVYALTAKGEAKIPLNPVGKDEAYIREIKAMFSTHVMGSPGGYPVYLKRWTRMGQARDESLAQLLLLGEQEAVVAAVHAPGLTDELAARAWWCMPTAENARRMLEKPAVAQGKTGRELAEFLLEFLPFEEEQRDMIESVRLVLQPGLISEEEKQKLWAKTKTKRSFYVGFLHALADDLPVEADAHPLYDTVSEPLQPLIEQANPYATLLEKVLSAKGQAFIQTCENAFKKPGNQDVVVSLLDAVANYFSAITPQTFTEDDMAAICREAEACCDSDNEAITQVLTAVGDNAETVRPYLCAMTALSCLSVKLVNPIFARTDAIGTVMRKKIKPVTDPVFEQLKVLRG